MAIWPQVLPELGVRVLSYIYPKELAGSVRLVCKAAAALLPVPKYTATLLSQRVPPHVFAHSWGPHGAMRSLTYKQRMELLCPTAASGSIPNVEFLLPRVSCLPREGVLAAAAAAGQLAVCQWLGQRGCPWNSEAAKAAGKTNRRAVCDWLVAAGCPDALQSAACCAALGGHVGLLDWLLPQLEPTPNRWVHRVAVVCDLAALQRLHAAWVGKKGGVEALGDGDRAALANNWVMAAAARSPTPDWRAKVEWLLAVGYLGACLRCGHQPPGRPGALGVAAGPWLSSWLHDHVGYELDGPAR